MRNPISIALVGIGEIARNQHIPSISKSSAFELVAAASRNGIVEGVSNYKCVDDLLSTGPDIGAVSLCTPPQFRFDMAWSALMAGKHVMLEKPPGATLSEIETLKSLADERGLSLFATWHSRYAPAVEPAREWLVDKKIERIQMIWKEDVKRWHPGQKWIWQAGGMGVFDPGINGLSILTHIVPHAFHLVSAKLQFPENCQTPIAASLFFTDHNQIEIYAEMDWRQEGHQSWDIEIETDAGVLKLANGGAIISISDEAQSELPEAEYDELYSRFSDLISTGTSDVDLRPIMHVADAFTLGERNVIEPFHG